MFEITTPSRVHMTLIDMNGGFGRQDGSAGLTLLEGGIRLRAKKSDVISIAGFDKTCFGPGTELFDYIQKSISPLLKEGDGIEIHLLSDVKQHIGLGSGTQLALSAAMALNELYDLKKSVRELAALTKRGGTSGIGVHAFEKGGFIVDAGHKTKDKNGFVPSSRSTAPPADLILRTEFPDWDVIVAIPPDTGISGDTEKHFFQSVCPIPKVEAFEVSHVILMQMVPAIIEKDIASLGDAVDRLQKVGFKKHEVEIQPPEVKSLMEDFKKCGVYGAGVSSFGPAVYGFSENRKDSENIKSALLEKMPPGSDVMITKANNSGAKWHV
ncbi:beta-ribofuranosylaminobenzene 5'-phosphate synthase [Methanolapillus millepedarum]|uniref:Beta-ribofuranosylaminobenzene 5'-phosphate synthase n=1 Tax=Methanolapillus millepedarum TaxID=3028296 RepID=A0AA96VCL2_9EURY|nr:hypothetical protein MsAc7_12690 [Methanosarcinaceae archaeon Ac7]